MFKAPTSLERQQTPASSLQVSLMMPSPPLHGSGKEGLMGTGISAESTNDAWIKTKKSII
ncbi:MAG: hypothetical protein ACRC4G_02940 [Alphaproteobacteria bacterium]